MNKICNDNHLFKKTGIFERFRNKRIFITGGTGFFGKNILDYLAKNDIWNGELYILSRNPDKFCQENQELSNLSGLNFVKGDVRSFEYSFLPNFDYAIHAATDVNVKPPEEKPDEIYSVIVDGTRRILGMCEAKKVKRLLYVSSGAVYGVQPTYLANIPENYPCKPINAYGKGKLDAENMCLTNGIDTVIARCFAFVGPYLPLDAHFAISNFINNILHNEDINIKGDGTPYRSYMYAGDLVEWLLTILLKGKTNEAYNVGSDKAISIADLAKLVCEYSSPGNTQINIAGKALKGTRPPRYVPDTAKCLNLGLKLKVSLTEGIKKTINGSVKSFMKKNKKSRM